MEKTEPSMFLFYPLQEKVKITGEGFSRKMAFHSDSTKGKYRLPSHDVVSPQMF